MIELLFKNILQISLVGSIGFLLILFLKNTLFEKYTKAFNYYIWLAIIVKMLMIFKIPIHISEKLIFKLYTIGEQLPNIIGTKALFNNNNAINENIKSTFMKEYSTYSNISILKIISYLWLIGVVAFVAYHLFSYFNFNNKIKYLTWEVSENNIDDIYSELMLEMKIKRKISLKFCRGIDSPLGIGFLNPCILLPKVTYSNEEIRWILKHELIHYKRHDIFYKFIVMITMAIYWFNPLVYIMQQIINSDCELSCDEAVLKNCNEKKRKLYAVTLLHSLKVNKKSSIQHSVSTGFNQNKNVLKRRLENMIDFKIRKKGIIIGALVAIITVSSLISIKIFAEDNINKTSTAELSNPYKVAYIDSDENIPKEYTEYLHVSDKKITNQTKDIKLTIDKDLQDAFDKAVKEFREKYQQSDANTPDTGNATRGAVAVIDVTTGNVVASASFGKVRD